MANKSYFSSIPNNSNLGDCEDGNCASNCNEQVSGNDCVAPHNHDNLYYRKQEINEMFESLGVDPDGEFIPAIIEEDITSTVTEGNINAGDVIAQGTSFTQFVKTFLVKTFEPTLVDPTLSLTNNIGVAEVGTEVNLIITSTFNQGVIRGLLIGDVWNPNLPQGPRSGEPTSYRYYSLNYGGDIINNTDDLVNSANKAGHIVQPGIETFSVLASYGMGAQPLDSTGEPFGSPLSSGGITSTTSVVGRYRTFYGPMLSVPTNGQALRAAPGSVYEDVSSFTLDSGTTQIYFIIGVPVGRSLASVIDLDASNQIITSDYVLVDANFTGRDAGGSPVTYKLYVKTNGTPYTTNHRHLITLI